MQRSSDGYTSVIPLAEREFSATWGCLSIRCNQIGATFLSALYSVILAPTLFSAKMNGFPESVIKICLGRGLTFALSRSLHGCPIIKSDALLVPKPNI